MGVQRVPPTLTCTIGPWCILDPKCQGLLMADGAINCTPTLLTVLTLHMCGHIHRYPGWVYIPDTLVIVPALALIPAGMPRQTPLVMPGQHRFQVPISTGDEHEVLGGAIVPGKELICALEYLQRARGMGRDRVVVTRLKYGERCPVYPIMKSFGRACVPSEQQQQQQQQAIRNSHQDSGNPEAPRCGSLAP